MKSDFMFHLTTGLLVGILGPLKNTGVGPHFSLPIFNDYVLSLSSHDYILSLFSLVFCYSVSFTVPNF